MAVPYGRRVRATQSWSERVALPLKETSAPPRDNPITPWPLREASPTFGCRWCPAWQRRPPVAQTTSATACLTSNKVIKLQFLADMITAPCWLRSEYVLVLKRLIQECQCATTSKRSVTLSSKFSTRQSSLLKPPVQALLDPKRNLVLCAFKLCRPSQSKALHQTRQRACRFFIYPLRLTRLFLLNNNPPPPPPALLLIICAGTKLLTARGLPSQPCPRSRRLAASRPASCATSRCVCVCACACACAKVDRESGSSLLGLLQGRKVECG
jgi:hypothetical protein